jgi:hypothetical protein
MSIQLEKTDVCLNVTYKENKNELRFKAEGH